MLNVFSSIQIKYSGELHAKSEKSTSSVEIACAKALVDANSIAKSFKGWLCV